MGRKDNPDLAPDAVLASDLGDPVERHAAQVAEMGGDIDDIDSYDPSAEDDGSVLPEGYAPPHPAPAAAKDDEETEDEDPDKDSSDGDADDAAESDDDDGDDQKDEEESEEAGDTDADDDSEVEDEAAPKSKGIPKWRFDEVNEGRKTAEAENAQLKAQIAAGKPPEDQEEPFDIMAGEKEYMDLLLDGDTEGALAKRVEVDAAKEAKWKAETQHSTTEQISTDAEQEELLSLSGEAQNMFDVFNPDHDDYNQPMLNKVLTFMRGYESSGEMSRGDAFVAALADVVDMYDLMPEEEEAEVDEDPKPTGKKKVDKKKAKLKEDAHIPVGGEGTGSAETGVAAVDVENMTDEEFDALPEKAQARLRGDIL